VRLSAGRRGRQNELHADTEEGTTRVWVNPSLSMALNCFGNLFKRGKSALRGQPGSERSERQEWSGDPGIDARRVGIAHQW